MMRGSLKWVLFGGLTATALSLGIFLNIPVSADLEEKDIKVEDVDYARSLYGVPVLEMSHYKLSGDTYLNYILAGGMSIGRENPSGLTTWYNNLLENPELLSVNSDLKLKIYGAMENDAKYNELTKALEKVLEDKKLEEEAERLKAEKEEADKEFAEEVEKEDVNEGELDGEIGNSSEDKISPVTYKGKDYLDSFEKEYGEFNKNVITLETKFEKSDWDNLKLNSDNYNLTLSNSLNKYKKELVEELNTDFVKYMTELNSYFIEYVKIYDNNFTGDVAKKDVKDIKDKIDKSIITIKKVLE